MVNIYKRHEEKRRERERERKKEKGKKRYGKLTLKEEKTENIRRERNTMYNECNKNIHVYGTHDWLDSRMAFSCAHTYAHKCANTQKYKAGAS